MAETKNKTVLPRKLLGKARAKPAGSDTERGSAIARPLADYLNTSIETLRNLGKPTAILRKMAKADGTVSASVFSFVQVAQSGYKLRAYNSTDHSFSPEGTHLANSVLASLDTLFDYTAGYGDKQTFNALVETSLREVTLTGALAGELVLNKARLPDRIVLIPYEDINFVSRGDGTKYPEQVGVNDGPINLDLSTFWVAESHKGADSAYADSMMEAAINTAVYFAEFIDDMRRVVRRSGHSRLTVTLNAERVRAAAPEDTQSDPEKLADWMNSVKNDVEITLTNLEPDEALVFYDTADTDSLTSDGEKADYTQLMGALTGMLATSLKTSPSILGLRLTGSQSLSNTESLVFLKVATAIQRPVEAFMSRAMTLAVRLYGEDVYVKFSFNPINLRPDDELEAFKTMRQQNILAQLSLGFITDEQAALELGTGPRPANAPELSGTFFHQTSSAEQNAQTPTPNSDPQGRALQPDTPDRAGGESQ